MRLTLRTLLAYLDEILEPADTQDIAKKIEESEFATQLVHRTRDCIRRLRLGVPAVLGRGLAADANTVAEYLDNTLAGDQVPEFEKICLESDVHLAEVAGCHQILTLVLGGPVEIPPESRQRMYGLAAQVDAPPVQSDALRTAAVPPPLQPAPRRAKPEVPEYLRESRSRIWPLAATILITAALTFGVLMVINPGGLRERVVAIGANPATEEAAEPGEASPEAAEATPAASTPEADTTAMPDEDAASEGAEAQKAEPSTPSREGELAAPLEAAEDPDAPTAPEPSDVPPTAKGGGASNLKRMPDDKSLDDQPAVGDKPAADVPMDDAAKPPATVPPATVPPATAPPAGAPAAPDEAAAARPVVDDEAFGRYTSKHEVLLRFDKATNDWKRLAPMAALAKEDRLLSLPSFRPTIVLASNVTIQPEGPALIELSGWTDQGVPIIAVEYGRVLMMTVGKTGNSVQVTFDRADTQLTFVDAQSALALEARRVLPPGRDPGAEKAPLSAELYVTSGLVRVRQGDSSTEVQGPGRKALVGSAEIFGAEFPKWVTSTEPQSDSDRLAATSLETMLPVDGEVGLKLKELSTARRREVRALAVRSACYLGNVEPCVQALNDPQEKQYWSGLDAPYILELRAAVARGPEMAAKVRAAFDKQRSDDSAALYRMLWGYSGEDLKNGADRDLVEGLEHDSLDYRVLAIWNLQHVTGLANLGYYPAELAAKRRASVKNWQKQLRDGKILPRSAAPAKAKGSPPKTS